MHVIFKPETLAIQYPNAEAPLGMTKNKKPYSPLFVLWNLPVSANVFFWGKSEKGKIEKAGGGGAGKKIKKKT